MSGDASITAIELRLIDGGDADAWPVYADYLSDIGDPRGELLSLVFSSGESTPGSRERVDELERALERDDPDTAHVLKARWWLWGFMHEADIHLDSDADIDTLARALATPAARLLREVSITLGDDLPADALARLATLPLLRARTLSIAEQRHGNALLGALAGVCTHLQELDARGSALTMPGVTALAELASRGTLRRLHLQRNHISGSGVALLAPKLVGLELLDLRDNDIGETGLAALARTPALGALRTLRLQLDTFRDDDLQPLARSRTLPPAIVRYVRALLEQRRGRR
jgi:hypothetical protein